MTFHNYPLFIYTQIPLSLSISNRVLVLIIERIVEISVFYS